MSTLKTAATLIAVLFLMGHREAGAYMISSRTGLPGLAQNADRIFAGTVVKKTLVEDRCGAISTQLAFQVTEGIKNATTQEIITFLRFGVDGETRLGGGERASESLGPRIDPGQPYLVFLSRPAEKCGYTTMLGLDKGLFRIETDPSGNVTATNGINNRLLFGSEEKRAASRTVTDPRLRAVVDHQEGPVDYSALVDLLHVVLETTAQ